MSSGVLAAIVAAVGFASWAGSFAFRWWDLLTAWLIWGSVVLVALLYELGRQSRDRRSSSMRSRHASNLATDVRERPSH